MARRPRRPGPSPADLLSVGNSWLDETPTFKNVGALEVEILKDIHRTARLIARRRAEVNVSQQQTATWAGVTRQTVAAIEDGTTWPDYLTVLKITAILGITVKADVIPGAKPFGPRNPSNLYRGR